MKRNISSRFPLSRFLAKTLRVNKPALKKFLKNLSFGFNVKLYFHSCTKLTQTTFTLHSSINVVSIYVVNFFVPSNFNLSLHSVQVAFFFGTNYEGLLYIHINILSSLLKTWYEGCLLYFGIWQPQCCNLPTDSSVVKLDIFKVIRAQNVLKYERYLYCVQ